MLSHARIYACMTGPSIRSNDGTRLQVIASLLPLPPTSANININIAHRRRRLLLVLCLL